MRKLTELYQGRLAQAFNGFVAPYPVRTIDGQFKYYMLFVTSHPRGVREMSDVLYRVEHEYVSEKQRTEASRTRQLGLGGDFGHPPASDAETEAELVARLAEDVYTVGKKYRQIVFGRLQDDLCVEARWFGTVVTPHYRRACALLIRQGRIDRDKETGIDDRTILSFV